MVRVTPPPASLAREDVLEGVRARAQMVAHHLGLNGLAQLDAFMHAESADLVVVHAHAIPDLSSTSDIFQQVGGRDPILDWGSELLEQAQPATALTECGMNPFQRRAIRQLPQHEGHYVR